MNNDQIKHMVDRFLGWKLPRDTFNPDCGISFDKKPFNAHTDHPSLYEPSGTNLFDAGQATDMVNYMAEGLPGGDWRPIATAPKDGTRVWLYYPEAHKDDRQVVGWYDRDAHDGDRWMDHADHYEFIEPTHWRELPAPPTD